MLWTGWVLSMFALASCQSSRAVAPEPCQKENPIVVSREAATALQNKLLANFGERAPRQFRLTTDDVEVTSYLAIQTAGSNLDAPQVWFIKGGACMTGVLLVIGPLRSTFSARVATQVEDGQVQLRVEHLRLGRWTVPESLNGMLSRIADETLQDARQSFRITELEIEPGRFTVAGTR